MIVIIGSYIHDASYRHLIEETNGIDDTSRIWCIVSYSSGLKIYNYFIHAFHVFGSYLINLISVIIIIIMKVKQQLVILTNRSYKELLLEEIRELKHLITGPIVLMLLTFPRLIMIFLSNCMQSSDDAWIFLMGYFISFIPCMFNFIIFVMSTKFYKEQFRQTIKTYRKKMQRQRNKSILYV